MKKYKYNSGVVSLYRDLLEEDIEKNINNLTDEHIRIIDLVFKGNIIIEKDNSAIKDVLDSFAWVNDGWGCCILRECEEVIKDMCIGYCIIPIRITE